MSRFFRLIVFALVVGMAVISLSVASRLKKDVQPVVEIAVSTDKPLSIRRLNLARKNLIRESVSRLSDSEKKYDDKKIFSFFNSENFETDLVEVRKAIDKGEKNHSDEILSEFSKSYPESIELQIEYAINEIWNGNNLEKGLVYFKNALKIAPGNSVLLNEVTQTYIKLNLLDEAVEFYGGLKYDLSDSSGIDFYLAKILFKMRNFNSALERLGFAIVNIENKYSAYALRGRIFLEQGDFSRSKNELSIAVAGLEKQIYDNLLEDNSVSILTENLDESLFVLADANVRLSDYDEAYQVISKLAERIPNDPRVVSLMDQIFQKKISSTL